MSARGGNAVVKHLHLPCLACLHLVTLLVRAERIHDFDLRERLGVIGRAESTVSPSEPGR